MPTQWYYQVRGENSSLVMGPVSLEVLGRLMQRGYIPPDSLVREGAGGDWVLAQSLNHLFNVTTDSKATDSQATDKAHYATVEDVRFVPETPPEKPPTYPPRQPTAGTAPSARRKRKTSRSWKSIGGFLAGACVGAVLGLVVGLVIARFQAPRQVSQQPPPPPVPPAQIDEKAVESFEDFVAQQVRQIRELEDVEYPLETNDGTKGTFKLEIDDEFSYDCRKNDSLLSPVTGVINLKRRRILTYYERLGELRIPQLWKDLKVDCSYRNGQWQCNTDVKKVLGIHE